jgi:hypothetical protein
MAKPKPVDVIGSALEPFLDELSDQWDSQPESQRRPTLPNGRFGQNQTLSSS